MNYKQKVQDKNNTMLYDMAFIYSNLKLINYIQDSIIYLSKTLH